MTCTRAIHISTRSIRSFATQTTHTTTNTGAASTETAGCVESLVIRWRWGDDPATTQRRRLWYHLPEITHITSYHTPLIQYTQSESCAGHPVRKGVTKTKANGLETRSENETRAQPVCNTNASRLRATYTQSLSYTHTCKSHDRVSVPFGDNCKKLRLSLTSVE